MRLTDLHPKFLALSDGRAGCGVQCDCPCGNPACLPLFVPFLNPLDGGPPFHVSATGEPWGWQRTGDTFETLTLTPSIQRMDKDGCRWHGFITNGEVTGA